MRWRRWLATRRKWWLLAAAVVLYLVAYDRLERLVRKEPATTAGAPAAGGEGILSPPGRPEVHRLEDGGIEIRHDFFRRSTIRLRGEEAREALRGCLEKGFQEAFQDGSESWGRSRVRSETRIVMDRCLAEVREGQAPSEPDPPDPPAEPPNLGGTR